MKVIYVECCWEGDIHCGWWEEYEEEPHTAVWYFNEEWKCPKCDMGLSRIIDPRNSLDGWVNHQ